MTLHSRRGRRLAIALVLTACAGLAAGCGSSSPSTSSGSPAGAPTTSGPSGTGTGALPTSCDQLKAAVSPYVGGVGVVKPLLQKANGVSCEFANGSATRILIVNIGPGTPAAFAVLKTKSGGQGRTTASVSGLGAQAFSTSNNGKPGGIAVLTSGGDVFAVITALPFSRDEALLRQLMSQY